MTEAEWSSATDSNTLLPWLAKNASARKFRLYLCGGCHAIRHLFFDSSSFNAVAVAERMADGLAGEKEIKRADWEAEAASFGYDFEEEFMRRDDEFFPRNALAKQYVQETLETLVRMGALSESVLTGGKWQVNEALRDQIVAAATLAYRCLYPDFTPDRYPNPDPCKWIITHIAQVDWPGRWLVDCVFGNPLRPVEVDPAWLAWKHGTVPAIAQGIYDDRAFGQLPILADALEEAGCSDPAMISHCRDETRHTRGCWVLDRLLGRE